MSGRGTAFLIVAAFTMVVQLSAMFWGRTGAWLWLPAVIVTVLVGLAIVDLFVGGGVDEDE